MSCAGREPLARHVTSVNDCEDTRTTSTIAVDKLSQASEIYNALFLKHRVRSPICEAVALAFGAIMRTRHDSNGQMLKA